MQNSVNRIFITLACLVIILAGVKSAGEIVVPFLLALFIAIICSPVIKAMTSRKIPQWLAITLLLGLILLIFFFLAGLIGSTVREFRASLPQYSELLNMRISEITALANRWNIQLDISRETVLEHFDPSTLMNFISNTLLGFSNVLSNVFVLLLVVVFMLLEAPTAKHKLALAIGGANKREVSREEHYIDRVLQGVINYLGIKTIVSALTGFCIYILLESLGVQYAVLWGVTGFLLNYIPNIGSIIAGVPVVVQALLLNGFSMGFVVLIGVIAINMIIGNILEPRMMGRNLGLSTLVVFLSLLFWGWLLGTVGMLLSVPLTMAVKIILESNPKTIHYAGLLGDVDET
ncbi:putative PurR-regulated permease PerM [Cricetibacter osteomyelitidis]|uniref:Putative PurR-regulated permease PerM n=1 Tax=Cricetibacter osteomyelitidis TaxID=1521931 RepID=A0A4R2TPL2_9PAST|nr:AI-2E family transporter [Cricetibacter osteomyelitidis]TCP96912.1 putative PurR-regulated permease PerM [Cricetibacter osteomyelitidis]